MPWNSQLGASRALSNGPTLVQQPKQTLRRWENWNDIKNAARSMLEMLVFLHFIVDEEYILPWKMRRRRQLAIAERRRNEPRTLPRHRRALSASNLDLSQKSALLSLPREIRLQIYSHVIGYDLLHLVQLPKRLCHFRCHRPSSSDLPQNETDTDIFWDVGRRCEKIGPRGTHPHSPYAYGQDLVYGGTSDDSLSLLQTSRQMYLDATYILYTTNTFEINHPQTLIFLDRTLLPHRIQSIRYLQIKWLTPDYFHHPRRVGRTEPDTVETWDQMCQIILTKMTGLRQIRLVYTSFAGSNLPLVFKLQCVEKLGNLETFELLRQGWDNREPFRFHRVPDGF